MTDFVFLSDIWPIIKLNHFDSYVPIVDTKIEGAPVIPNKMLLLNINYKNIKVKHFCPIAPSQVYSQVKTLILLLVVENFEVCRAVSQFFYCCHIEPGRQVIKLI